MVPYFGTKKENRNCAFLSWLGARARSPPPPPPPERNVIIKNALLKLKPVIIANWKCHYICYWGGKAFKNKQDLNFIRISDGDVSLLSVHRLWGTKPCQRPIQQIPFFLHSGAGYAVRTSFWTTEIPRFARQTEARRAATNERDTGKQIVSGCGMGFLFWILDTTGLF